MGGLVSNFNYLAEVDINIHDTYLVTSALDVSFVIWVMLSFLYFLTAVISTDFQVKKYLIGLLASNLLLIGLLVLIIFSLMTFYSIEEAARTITYQLSNSESDKLVILIFWIVPLLALVILEIFLARKVYKFGFNK